MGFTKHFNLHFRFNSLFHHLLRDIVHSAGRKTFVREARAFSFANIDKAGLDLGKSKIYISIHLIILKLQNNLQNDECNKF